MNKNRYLRHSIIDWFDQDYMANLNVLVVGAGALGNETIKNLVLLGCGNIDIYDFDTIEEHNLTRSVLFNENDIGKNKAETIAEKGKQLDPNIIINYFTSDITFSLTPSKVQKYDIVFCCVDNFESRIYLNKICFLMKIDLVNMGMDSRYQSTEIFPFSSEDSCSCYECNLPYSVYDRLKKRYSCGGLKKLSYIEKKIPTTIITSSMASFGVSLGLRLGHNNIYKSTKLFIDTISADITKTFYEKNKNCPICSTDSKKIKLLTFVKTSELEFDEENITLTLSHSIIKNIECKVCNEREYFQEFHYRNASKYDDSLTICPKCNNQGVDIEVSDIIQISELKYLIKNDNFIDLTYISYESNDCIYIISKGEK